MYLYLKYFDSQVIALLLKILFGSILYFGQYGFKILFQNTFDFPDYRSAYYDGIGLDIWSTVRPLHLSILYDKYGYWC